MKRRDFIKKSFLTAIGLSISNVTLANVFDYNTLEKTVINPDIDRLLNEGFIELERDNITLAESLFNQVLSIDQSITLAYFGLRKCYLIQNKFIQNIKIFELGVSNNPTNYTLKAQLAKEYTSIAIGNEKVSKELNYNFSLLEKAKELLLEAIDLYNSFHPQARGIEVEIPTWNANYSLEKLDNITESNLTNIDARDNPDIKRIRKENKIKHKNRYKDLSKDELVSKINVLKQKSEDLFRDKHIKELYINLINRLQKNSIEKFNVIYEMYLFDKQDSQTLHKLKRSCLYHEKYTLLREVLLLNNTTKNNFYSNISYFDVIYKENTKKSTVPSSDKNLMISLLNNLGNLAKTPNFKLELLYRQVLYYNLINNKNLYESNLFDLTIFLKLSHNPHDVIRMLRLSRNYFISRNQIELFNRIINSLINKNTGNIVPDSPILENIFITISNPNLKVLKHSHIEELGKIKII